MPCPNKKHKMENLQEFGKLSEPELAKLKETHKKVFELKVPFETSENVVLLYGYLRMPKRYELGMSLAQMDSNPVLAKEIILEKTWLAGDARIKTDDDAFYSAINVLDELITVRQAELKKN